MDPIVIIAIVAVVVSSVAVAILLLRLGAVSARARASGAELETLRTELETLRTDLARYAGIRDIEAEARTLQRSNAEARAAHDQTVSALNGLTRDLSRLKAEMEATEEAIDLQSFGFYRARYDFASSSEYSDRVERVREQQKAMIKDDTAATCAIGWSVDGNLAKGRKMIREQVKLMLRAFNGECEAAIAKVKYNNVTRLESRIVKSWEAINKLGSTNQTYISERYRRLKLEELFLVHEYQEKVQEEKEEQQRIKEQMREEQQAEKELEKALRDAEKEETRFEKALEKARAELAAASGAQHEKFAELVTRLETELKDALERKAKAIARAQLTRSGHVYVISNIGSFGDDVFKIGLTRRLEPLDRVRELGGASVPFLFDVHAMIYSEDAPALEAALHRRFHQRRVNKINARKEYFRVSLEEIRRAVAEEHGIVTFVTVPTAEEYYKTLALEREEPEVAALA